MCRSPIAPVLHSVLRRGGPTAATPRRVGALLRQRELPEKPREFVVEASDRGPAIPSIERILPARYGGTTGLGRDSSGPTPL